MKRFLAVLAVAPMLAVAQSPAPPGAGADKAPPRFDPARIEKRVRLARTLGLAEALDLDAAQAIKLGDAVAKFDDKRMAAFKQLRDAAGVLRKAAAGEKVAGADVDKAIQSGLDARAQLQAIDRDVVQLVTKDQPPEKRARAVLFLARFGHRFGKVGPGMGMHGPEGRMGPGMMGPGMHGHGMGHGQKGPDAGPSGMAAGVPGPMMGMAPEEAPDDWGDDD